MAWWLENRVRDGKVAGSIHDYFEQSIKSLMATRVLRLGLPMTPDMSTHCCPLMCVRKNAQIWLNPTTIKRTVVNKIFKLKYFIKFLNQLDIVFTCYQPDQLSNYQFGYESILTDRFYP